MVEDYPGHYLYKRIVQAKLFIDGNYHKNIDLDVISDESNFSKFHFIRLFKELYGKTPHQYLISVRIKRAKDLLLNDLSVTATCFAVGFDSPSSFTALFKRTVGLTPSDFQKQGKQKRIQVSKTPLMHIPNCFIENMSEK